MHRTSIPQVPLQFFQDLKIGSDECEDLSSVNIEFQTQPKLDPQIKGYNLHQNIDLSENFMLCHENKRTT